GAGAAWRSVTSDSTASSSPRVVEKNPLQPARMVANSTTENAPRTATGKPIVGHPARTAGADGDCSRSAGRCAFCRRWPATTFAMAERDEVVDSFPRCGSAQSFDSGTGLYCCCNTCPASTHAG